MPGGSAAFLCAAAIIYIPVVVAFITVWSLSAFVCTWTLCSLISVYIFGLVRHPSHLFYLALPWQVFAYLYLLFAHPPRRASPDPWLPDPRAFGYVDEVYDYARREPVSLHL